MGKLVNLVHVTVALGYLEKIKPAMLDNARRQTDHFKAYWKILEELGDNLQRQVQLYAIGLRPLLGRLGVAQFPVKADTCMGAGRGQIGQNAVNYRDQHQGEDGCYTEPAKHHPADGAPCLYTGAGAEDQRQRAEHRR